MSIDSWPDGLVTAFFISSPTWGVLLFIILKRGFSDFAGWWQAYIAICVVVSSLFIPSAWHVHPFFGMVLAVSAYSTVCFVCEQIFFEKLPIWSLYMSFSLVGLSVIVLVPTMLLQSWQPDRSKLITANTSDEAVALEF
jgi:hypothetical protein